MRGSFITQNQGTTHSERSAGAQGALWSGAEGTDVLGYLQDARFDLFLVGLPGGLTQKLSLSPR